MPRTWACLYSFMDKLSHSAAAREMRDDGSMFLRMLSPYTSVLRSRAGACHALPEACPLRLRRSALMFNRQSAYLGAAFAKCFFSAP